MAELDDLFDELNRLKKSTYSAEETIALADNLSRKFNRGWEDANRRIEYLRSDEYMNSMVQNILETTKYFASEIYVENVKLAVEEAPEFAIPPYLVPLLDISRNERLFDIRVVKKACSSYVKVNLRMNEVAGNIQDYANAIDAAREIMGEKEDRDPEKASAYWANRVYPNKAKYTHVLGLRFGELSEEAPFWSLLDNGNVDTSMSSDIGGYPFPSNGPTHFVDKTEREIEQLFNRELDNACEERSKMIESLYDEFDRYQQAGEEINELVTKLEEDISKADEVEEYLRVHTAEEIDPRRLREAIKRAQEGFEGRVEVGRSGSRVRLSYSTLRALAE